MRFIDPDGMRPVNTAEQYQDETDVKQKQEKENQAKQAAVQGMIEAAWAKTNANKTEDEKLSNTENNESDETSLGNNHRDERNGNNIILGSGDGQVKPPGKKKFPSFSTLRNNYPPDVNGSHAHPSKDPYPNQCAIRVGDAFMKSGIDMSSYPKVNKTSDGYPRSSKGLADWTWQNFGKPKIMSQDVFERDYKNSTGLMYIAPPPGGVGHIDLFNAGFTGSGYYLGSEIWFWPIK